jgi:hypothetical protein
MKDLLDFQRLQIQTLQAKVCEQQGIINRLETYCFEALAEECPKEYKTVIKQEIYTLNKQ